MAANVRLHVEQQWLVLKRIASQLLINHLGVGLAHPRLNITGHF